MKKKFFNEVFELKNFSGAALPELKWHTCVQITNELMNMATGAMYVRTYFKHSAKADAEEMIQTILEEFRLILNEETWLSDQAREDALAKANNIYKKIGYPDFLENDTAVENYYNEYTVFENFYFKTKFNFLRLETKRSFQLISDAVDRGRFAKFFKISNHFYQEYILRRV